MRIPKRVRRVLRRWGLVRPKAKPNKLAFLFTGAEQNLRPDSGLWNNSIFYRTVEQGSERIEEARGWSPLHLLYHDAHYPDISAIEKRLLSGLLVQIGVYEMYRACGVAPQAVAGLSAGEIPAAYAANLGDFEFAVDKSILGANLVANAGKGKCFQTVRLPAELTAELTALRAFLIVDAPTDQTWSVATADIPAVQAWFTAHEVQARVVSRYLPHTPFINRDQFEEGIGDLQPRAPSIPLYAGVTGGQVEGTVDAKAWWRFMTERVQANSVLAALLRDGFNTIVVIGTGGETFRQFKSGMASNLNVKILDGLPRNMTEPLIPSETRTALQSLGFPLADETLKRHMRTAGTPPVVKNLTLPFPDLDDPDFILKPYEAYRRWREIAPVHYLPRQNGWLVLNYDDIVTVLRDTSKFSSAPYRAFSHLLSGNDPPDHTRVRRLMTPHFARERVQARAPRVETIVREHLKTLPERATFEVNAALAEPLTARLTADFLGIPAHKLNELRYVLANGATVEFLQNEVVGDGILQSLIDDAALPRDEVAPLAQFLIGAGIVTIRDFIGNALYSLLQHPEWLDEIRAKPEHIPDLTEELLRYEPPVFMLLRTPITTVNIAGTDLPPYSLIYLAIGAANRDPSKYEQPDEIRPGRTIHRHLSFSMGPHYCLGAYFGTLECETILRVLLTEYPRLRAMESLDQVGFTGQPHERTVASLRVAFT